MASPSQDFTDISGPNSRASDTPLTSSRSKLNSNPDGRPTTTMHEGSHGVQDPTTYAVGGVKDIHSTDEVLGQFSFAPATQTTVVTTTTTTTTSFPPLMMRAPTHLYRLDPKLYPLAASPTPQALKKLSFEAGGRRTLFQEAENAAQALQTVGVHLVIYWTPENFLTFDVSCNNSSGSYEIRRVSSVKSRIFDQISNRPERCPPRARPNLALKAQANSIAHRGGPSHQYRSLRLPDE